MAPATCANDLPLETTGDRCEPLGSDGMWTKCGPDRAAERPGCNLVASHQPYPDDPVSHGREIADGSVDFL
jgi:hypothetical protein